MSLVEEQLQPTCQSRDVYPQVLHALPLVPAQRGKVLHALGIKPGPVRYTLAPTT